jgi:hypothetical protein
MQIRIRGKKGHLFAVILYIPSLLQVLAFTNLTLSQLRNAIDLFASFIGKSRAPLEGNVS